MLNPRSTTGLLSRARSTARGFTLLEIIVAVGAVAIVSIGIAAIFDSVGKTVNVGRRVSRTQAIAARVERQIRDDFTGITREGFLLVRNQMTSKLGGSNPPYAAYVKAALSERDTDAGKSPRDRRIDEVLFFAKGNFASAMEPLTPDYIPQSNEAMLYYGHGTERDPSLEPGSGSSNTSLYSAPRLDDDMSSMVQVRELGTASGLGLDPAQFPAAASLTNRNRYAANWTLLRKPILLIQPSRSKQVLPPPNADISTTPLTQQMLQDSDVQILLQPAASSIFRRLARVYPFERPSISPTDPAAMALWALRDDTLVASSGVTAWTGELPANRPLISSGTVDVATTDLDEVRRIVTTCPLGPTQFTAAYSGVQLASPQSVSNASGLANPPVFPDPVDPNTLPWISYTAPVSAATNIWSTSGAPAYRDRPVFDFVNGSYQNQAATILRTHSWMENALPNRSDGFTELYEIVGSSGQSNDRRQPGARVRCQTNWTRQESVIPVSGATYADKLQAYWRRRNQLALGAHNFLEHCSEFIVEWSFGLTDPRTGSVIWYGTPYQDKSGSIDAATEMTVYRGDASPADLRNLPASYDATRMPYNPWVGDQSLPMQFSADPADINDTNNIYAYHVSKHLIYGNLAPFSVTSFPAPADSSSCFTAHFGYFDPTFNGQGHIKPTDAASPTYAALGYTTLPWAWPKMLRFTIRIADENDPTIEDSFQFVVDLPPTPRP